MSFNPGENVGPYRIIEQLGQGGMATVYKAYHAALDRYVALKVLHPAFNEDRTFQMRFQREARVVARLEHAHIVPVYDYADHEGRPYLVMKFIEGETLKARLQRGPLSAAEIQQVVDWIGSALSHAHQQGILHRDIKPSNVLIATDGVMYLADFGLARIAQAGESTLSSDSIMGTPQYISPEQAQGSKELDEGTDIYSFGVMLYEMVVGRVPFNADTPFSIIHDHIYSPLPMPRQVNPSVPESVELVLLKSLAKDRSDRYASVAEMMLAFKGAWDAAGVPMQGTSLTLPYSPSKPEPVRPRPTVDENKPTVVARKAPAQKPAWPLVAGAVVILLCLAVGALALRGGNLRRILARPLLSTSTLLASTPTSAQVQVSLPTSVPATPTVLPPDVAAAMEKVRATPGDPGPQLELSLAYWDAGMQRAALETLKSAADLADGDREFLTSAALQFSARQAWIAAAGMYIRLVRTYPADETLPTDLINDLHESVYRAAAQADIPSYLTFDSLERLDQPLGLVARGRFALYNDRIKEARLELNQVKLLKPDFPESVLLEAEILAKEGRIDEARQLLTVTASDLGLADWLRTMADEIQKGLP